MITVGIDPGKTGGIAIVETVATNAGNTFEARCEKFDGLTDRDIYETIRDLATLSPIVWLENVHSMPTDGHVGAFRFGENFGLIKGSLIGCDARYGLVTPAKWQKPLGLTRKNPKEKSVDKKRRHKALAQQLYPKVKVTLWNCDALLIAHWGQKYG